MQVTQQSSGDELHECNSFQHCHVMVQITEDTARTEKQAQQ